MARTSVPEVHAGRPVDATPASTDFRAAIRANKSNTFWLCAILIVIGMMLGAAIGGLIGAFALSGPIGPSELPREMVVAIIIGAGAMLAISLIATWVALEFGGSIVAGLAGAKTVTQDQEPRLYNVVEEMCIAAGLPMPRVVVIETAALNAFATGTGSTKAVVGVTRGLLDTMNRDELQGVIAHEMSHIANDDILYATAVAVLVGLIVLICDMARRVGFRTMRFGGRRNAGPMVIALVILLVFSILAPLAATLVRMAISRQREYLADATSVKLTRNPLGLASALRKIGASAERMESPNRAIQHVFIANPIEAFDESASALMSTHPPIERRIERLLNLGEA